MTTPNPTPHANSHDNPDGPVTFNALAGLAAAVFPGAGHLVLGEKRRAALVMTGVLGLFFGGILIGGIDVIDSREDRVWFFGQALVGPIAFGVDSLHQRAFKGIPASFTDLKATSGTRSTTEMRLTQGRSVSRSAYPDETRRVEPVTIELPGGGTRVENIPILVATPGSPGNPPNIKSVSKVNELGTLFATIAGMLNVIVIVDAALPGRRKG